MDFPLTVFFLLPVAREEPMWHLCEVLQLKAFMILWPHPLHRVTLVCVLTWNPLLARVSHRLQ